ncbi:DUF748 domain-containing protein [Microbulbifer sp. 2201CG32-9]|uniref:DUF748 domain-containing protein n=1 Tax=Microbulbifer sp. 2201CG32-9 TaxID=3232309 RepID=UPI00345C3CD3
MANSTHRHVRLLWWLLGLLLVVGILNIMAGALLVNRLEAWLEQRGLTLEVGSQQLFLPELRVQMQGVSVRGARGKRFTARELMLDYSWWQLLRGRLRAQQVYLRGVSMELESSPSEFGRAWDIGGWSLVPGGERRDRNLRLEIGRLDIRDSRVCYRHRPQWSTPSCVGVGQLSAADWVLDMRRSGDQRLQLQLGADAVDLRDLLAEEAGSGRADAVLVRAQLSRSFFTRPDNRISVGHARFSRFGSCPPQRWADALPALGRLIGHCATARRLQLSGGAEFGFGPGAEVRWHSAEGRDLVLRYQNRRWQNWRAGSVAIGDFSYVRAQKKLDWQLGLAREFDWCPKQWRNHRQHFCVRAGKLQLPAPVSFDWKDSLLVAVGPGRLRRTQVLDVAGDNSDPFTVNAVQLEGVGYRAASRQLSLSGLDLDSAAGCLPGRLSQGDFYCLRLESLHGTEGLDLRFPSRAADSSWGLSGGPLQLAGLWLQKGGETQLQLRALHWRQIDAMRGEGPLLLQDFSAQLLRGCVPAGIWGQVDEPLCADVSALSGDGGFVWQPGARGYWVMGELRAERALFADSLRGQGGLLVEKLHTGAGFYRVRTGAKGLWQHSPGLASGTVAGAAGIRSNAGVPGAEKGLLPEELERRRARGSKAAGGPGSIADPSAELHSLSLSRVSGCLSRGWAEALYRDFTHMPTCMDLINLHQRRPLRLAWNRAGEDTAAGFALEGAELSLDEARARSYGGEQLLEVQALRMPAMRLGYAPGDFRFEAPDLSLQQLEACRPGGMATPGSIRCVEVRRVRFGNPFALVMSRQQVVAKVTESSVYLIRATDIDGTELLGMERLLVPRLEVAWHRRSDSPAELAVEKLSLEKLHGCLPPAGDTEGTPYCLSLRQLNSTGNNGFEMADIQLRSAVDKEAWGVAGLAVDALTLSPQALGFGAVQLTDLRGCGGAGWPSTESPEACLEMQSLHLRADSRIGLIDGLPPLQLAALESSPLVYRSSGLDETQLSLKSISWEQMQWLGGSRYRLQDFALRDFDGCLPPSTSGGQRRCAALSELRLAGIQTLSLEAPFSTTGVISVREASIGSGSDAWRIEEAYLEQPVLDQSADRVLSGSLTQLRGCATLVGPAGRRMHPCYRIGPVRFAAVERADSQLVVRDLAVDGVQVTQADPPLGLPAPLLQLGAVALTRLTIGDAGVEVGGMRVANLESCIPNGVFARVNHCVSAERLAANGRMADGGKFFLQELQLGELQLQNHTGWQLSELQSARLQDFSWDGDKLTLALLQAADLKLIARPARGAEAERDPWVIEVGGLSMEQLRYGRSGRALQLSRIALGQPKLILERDRDGHLPVRAGFAALTGGDSRADRPARKAEGPRFRYRLEELAVQEGNFVWLDRLGEFGARVPVDGINLLLRGASNYPHHAPARLFVSGHPGQQGKLQVQGEIDYLANKKWDASLSGYLLNANLIPATPYIANLLGFKILQGQMDAQFEIAIRSNKVDASVDITLHKPRVRRVRDSDQLQVESSMIPLNVALLLLEDGQQNVKFSMPVSGDLYDPKFSFSFIFSHLLQQAILETLFSYFTPLGFYTLAKRAWARFQWVRIAPVDFAPGSAELDNDAKAQLARAVEILRRHQVARPGVCGIANARDWQALYPGQAVSLRAARKVRERFYRAPSPDKYREFEWLAEQRSQAVSRYLLDGGILPDRFIQCAPDYDGGDFGRPRVEFSR